MKLAQLPYFALFGGLTVQAQSGDGVFECKLNDDGSKPPCWDPIKAMIDRIQAAEDRQRSIPNTHVEEVLHPRPRSGSFQPVEYKLSDSKVVDYLNIDTSGKGNGDGQEHARKRRQSGGFGMGLSIEAPADYGCWCYSGSNWPTMNGVSRARDEHDEACKAHSMAFKCIKSDAQALGITDCDDPDNVSYEVTVAQTAYNTMALQCSNSIADDWCKRRVCMVELRLVVRYWTLLKQFIFPNYALWGHDNFDHMTECEPIPGIGGPRREVCCGDYPYRVWFHQDIPELGDDPNVQCCEFQTEEVNRGYGFEINQGKWFNRNHQTCTDDGVEEFATDIKGENVNVDGPTN